MTCKRCGEDGKRIMNEICHICQKPLHAFMTTPVLELEDGSFKECCEECADREFPGWDEDES